MGFWTKLKADVAEAEKHLPYNAAFQGVRVQNGEITFELDHRTATRPAAGISAEVESGSEIRSATATRVIAGGILLGPVGAVVGGMLKKDRTKVYVIVNIPDAGVIILAAPEKDGQKAREFAAKVNAAGTHYT